MSVIIKDMKIPKSCGRCWFNNSSLSCSVTGSCIDRDDENRERLDDCPFVALPDKHGDLIDRDAFKADYGMKDDCADCEKEMHGKVKACEYDRTYSKMDFCDWLDNADVVIEAEGTDEGSN